MNTSVILKLQYALKQKGYIVTIPVKQYYNSGPDNFLKVYRVMHNKKVLFSTASKLQLVKFMSTLLSIVNEVETEEDIENKLKEIYDEKRKT